MRRALRLLALLLIGCVSGPAFGNNGPAQDYQSRYVKLRYPAGQIYRQDQAFPVLLEFRAPKDRSATYRIEWPTHGMSVPEEWRLLEVAPGQTRRLSLVFPPNKASSLFGLRVNDQSLSMDFSSSSNHPVVGVLAPQDESFDYLRSLALLEETNYSSNYEEEAEKNLVPLSQVAQLEAEILPEAWSALENLDVIVVYDWTRLNLNDRQTRALLDWTRWRGHLILVSNGLAEEYRGTPLEQYLPLQARSVRTSGETVQLVGNPAPDAEVASLFRGVPLAVSRPYLQGRISMITAPLTRMEPLSQAEAEDLWRPLIQKISAPDPIAVQGSSGYLITDMPELPRVQAGYVVLLILVYAVAVGPVNLSYLRRRDKMLMSFVTVPFIAVAFAGAVYLLSLLNRSSVPVLREVGVAHFQYGSSVGLAGSEMVLFSPYRAQYRLDAAPSAIFGEFSYRSQQKSLSVYQPNGEGGLSSTVSMATWDLLAVEARSLKSIEEPIQIALEEDTLVVNSPWETEADQACFWHAQKGVSAPFTLQKGENRIPLDFSHGENFGSTFSSLEHPEWELSQRPGRERLLSMNLHNSLLLQDPSMVGRLLLWTDQLPTEISTEPTAGRKSDTFVVFDLSGPSASQEAR